MHGRFGELGRIEAHRELGRDYLDRDFPTQAVLLVEARRIGNGSIDYDFYRARAVMERTRVRRAALTALTRFIRRVTLTIGRKDSPAG